MNLKKIKGSDEYINKINKAIVKIKTNKKALKKIQSKIYDIKGKLASLPSSVKTTKILALMDYIDKKIKLELYRLP
jgi:cob(I)alamin adenosyltransferase